MNTANLAAHPPLTGTSGIDFTQAMAFIWREAEMLDRHDYSPWLALWTEDGRYIIPIDQDETADPLNSLNIAYDDAEMRKARVKRLRSGFAMSSAPAARTARTVSRFVVVGDSEDGLDIRAVQHIVEYKFDRTRILAGEVLYRLVCGTDGLALARKEIRLLNSDDPLWGIGYLL
ncbi:3-phenylpropionate/cinnamic acid dioxygenase small subunit [Novosphingobium hassiacum]|uniref:3-phenylpropionate/cinnamic acid dioxygenase small subunit n=1 Tax=Novosphingobium hassiacum TaxID=173676 RepID=A0A7W6EWJ0_9SPHN|nr:aromatic-ring-hydroxylating dioxygenase subunit beta [Novosphingobium hassiacum]MBB3861286.1 3-phenylpropionate/cinnamic acid dioxygenase small subunit [Novosphingobium hassiacum]